MLLKGTWLIERSHFKTVSVSSDGNAISGLEATEKLVIGGCKDETDTEDGHPRRYEIRIRSNKLYINEFNNQPNMPVYAFTRCK